MENREELEIVGSIMKEVLFMEPEPLYLFNDVTGPEEAIFQALGAVSVCWEHIELAGMFDSSRAKAIGDALILKLIEFGL